MTYSINRIGTVHSGADGFYIEIEPQYRDALKGLEDFGCIQVIWWFNGCDTPEFRSILCENRPYKNGPETLGVFATRSAQRPNPIALSCAHTTFADRERGIIGVDWIDANDGSPVIDIKPYTPSLDRIESPDVPDWCAHWPKNTETSGDFDWAAEFNF